MTTALQPTGATPTIDLATPNGKKLPMATFVEKYVTGEIKLSGDLQAFFRPSLTLIDGVRILTRGGPQGGDLTAVRKLDMVIASADPVAAEARGLALFSRKPSEFKRIAFAEARQLGRGAWSPEEERLLEIAG